MRSKYLKALTAIVECEGYSIDRVDVNRHAKVYIKDKLGQTRFVTVSITPSDHRTLKNFKRDVRHLFNEHN